MMDLFSLQLQFTIAVAFVMAIRLFMKGMPKKYSYALWILVFARLLIPFSIETEHAMMPQSEMIAEIDLREEREMSGIRVGGGMPAQPAGNYEAAAGGHTASEEQGKSVRAWRSLPYIVWCLVAVSILVLNLTALWEIRKRIGGAERLRDNIYLTDAIGTPFTIGIFKTKIYLPSSLGEDERGYIIRHEQIHARRKDNLVKNVAFVLAAAYWFNPFVWIAFYLLEQDMEMSCDEAVLQELGAEIKRRYSQSLLNFAVRKKRRALTPLTFGEVSVKQRVKNVLAKKSVKRWMGALGAALVIGSAFLMFTQRKPADVRKQPESPKECAELFLEEFFSFNKDGRYFEGKELEESFLEQYYEPFRTYATEEYVERLMTNREPMKYDRKVLEEGYETVIVEAIDLTKDSGDDYDFQVTLSMKKEGDSKSGGDPMTCSGSLSMEDQKVSNLYLSSMSDNTDAYNGTAGGGVD